MHKLMDKDHVSEVREDRLCWSVVGRVGLEPTT